MMDLLLGLRGIEPQAFSRLVEIPFQGTTLKFIGREDFIAMKVFAGGPMDLLDATRAISAGRTSLDFVFTIGQAFLVSAVLLHAGRRCYGALSVGLSLL